VGVVLSSPVIQSTPPIEAESVQPTESTAGAVESPVRARTEEMPSESNDATEIMQPTAVDNGAAVESGAASGPFLVLTSTAMGRTSRYI